MTQRRSERGTLSRIVPPNFLASLLCALPGIHRARERCSRVEIYQGYICCPGVTPTGGMF